MNHVSEGTLQALLDEELSGEDRSRVERHLVDCATCEALAAELRDASASLESALALLDRPAPLEAAEDAFRRRRAREKMAAGRRSLLRAAILVLGFAAVGSAAIPNSPIRSWAAAAWEEWSHRPQPVAQQPAEQSEAEVAESGVSIRPADGRVRIVVEAPAPGVTARIRLVDDDLVSVRARGDASEARFRTSPGRIDIVAPGAGELEVEVPATLAGAVLEADGRVVVSKEGALLQILDAQEEAAIEVVVTLTESVNPS